MHDSSDSRSLGARFCGALGPDMPRDADELAPVECPSPSFRGGDDAWSALQFAALTLVGALLGVALGALALAP